MYIHVSSLWEATSVFLVLLRAQSAFLVLGCAPSLFLSTLMSTISISKYSFEQHLCYSVLGRAPSAFNCFLRKTIGLLSFYEHRLYSSFCSLPKSDPSVFSNLCISTIATFCSFHFTTLSSFFPPFVFLYHTLLPFQRIRILYRSRWWVSYYSSFISFRIYYITYVTVFCCKESFVIDPLAGCVSSPFPTSRTRFGIVPSTSRVCFVILSLQHMACFVIVSSYCTRRPLWRPSSSFPLTLHGVLPHRFLLLYMASFVIVSPTVHGVLSHHFLLLYMASFDIVSSYCTMASFVIVSSYCTMASFVIVTPTVHGVLRHRFLLLYLAPFFIVSSYCTWRP